MSWGQIKEISEENFVEIGNHSHTHEYLADENNEVIKEDIEKSISIFKTNLGKNSDFFSYPFGEYSNNFKNIIKQFGFKFAFGQHSGVIDETKNFYELPRFPINEDYGNLKRFKSIINSFPLEYEQLFPLEKRLTKKTNLPEFKVKFFKDQKNLKNINCYSNELGKWEKSKTYLSNQILTIKFRGSFNLRRGRINCSLNDNGKWRWFGVQFPIKEN